MAFNAEYIRYYFKDLLVNNNILPEKNISLFARLRDSVMQQLPSAFIMIASGNGIIFENHDPRAYKSNMVYSVFERNLNCEIQFFANTNEAGNEQNIHYLLSKFYRAFEDSQIVAGTVPAIITDYTDLSRSIRIMGITENYGFDPEQSERIGRLVETAIININMQFREHIKKN